MRFDSSHETANPAPFRDCRAILLDFGGTLDSDGEHWLDRTFRLYEASSLTAPKDEIKRAFYYADDQCCADPSILSMNLWGLMERHVHLQFQALRLRDHSKERDVIYGFCSESEQYLRKRAPLLRGLKNRFQLGVVSNFYGNLSPVCEEMGISESLRFIIDSNRVGVRKPDPAIFKLALTQLNLDPQQVIFVGDSYERDMIPSSRAGMKTVWLKGPNPRIPVETIHLDASIGRLSQLVELLP